MRALVVGCGVPGGAIAPALPTTRSFGSLVLGVILGTCALAASAARADAGLSGGRARAELRSPAPASLEAPPLPSTKGFVVAPASGGGLLSDPFIETRRVTWTGECLARVREALPAPDRLPPPQCLMNTVVREEHALGEFELEDRRAELIESSPALKEAWRKCSVARRAEECLDELAPLTAPNTSNAHSSQPYEARCHLTKLEPKSGIAVFECRGARVEATCGSHWAASYLQSRQATCSKDRLSFRLEARLGAAPSARCVSAAHAAQGADKERFAAAREKALTACFRDATPNPYWTEGPRARAFMTPPLDQSDLPAGSRGLIRSVLERQMELFGALDLRPGCRAVGYGCVRDEGESEKEGKDIIAAVLSRGCGTEVAAIGRGDNVSGMGGHWIDWKGAWLVRVPEGQPPIPPIVSTGLLGSSYVGLAFPSEPPLGIRNSYRSGGIPLRARADETHDVLGRRYRWLAGELIAEWCVDAGGPRVACERYALGSALAPCEGQECDSKRAKELIAESWPHATARLERWQDELARGIRLDRMSGESAAQTCMPVLIEACTGDIAEVCARSSNSSERCAGKRLEDGRCEYWQFGRLPFVRR